MIIQRDLLRDQVRTEIVERIVDGRLEALTRINESTLAADLGVSRTPLREALLTLQEEGFVDAEPRRGFRVAALSESEVQELYPLVAALEGLAVRTSAQDLDVASLRDTNAQILKRRDDPDRCLDLDAEFHRQLVAGCRNKRLLTMLAGLKRSLLRYETRYMRATAGHSDVPRTMESSVAEHAAIVEALEREDRWAAAAAIEDNWSNGMNRLLEILRGG